MKPTPPLNDMLDGARRVHGWQAERLRANSMEPRPGFVDRVINASARLDREVPWTVRQLEWVAARAVVVAACVTVAFAVLPAQPVRVTLDQAAQPWLEMPGQNSIWGGL